MDYYLFREDIFIFSHNKELPLSFYCTEHWRSIFIKSNRTIDMIIRSKGISNNFYKFLLSSFHEPCWTWTISFHTYEPIIRITLLFIVHEIILLPKTRDISVIFISELVNIDIIPMNLIKPFTYSSLLSIESFTNECLFSSLFCDVYNLHRGSSKTCIDIMCRSPFDIIKICSHFTVVDEYMSSP